MEVPKKPHDKNGREDKQIWAGLSYKLISVRKQNVSKSVTLNVKNSSLPYNKHLIKPSRSVWENPDLGHVYRPHCVPSVLTILPYIPPVRL